jgi:hypothetical protein
MNWKTPNTFSNALLQLIKCLESHKDRKSASKGWMMLSTLLHSDIQYKGATQGTPNSIPDAGVTKIANHTNL